MKFEESHLVNDSFSVDNIKISTGQFASNSKLQVQYTFVVGTEVLCNVIN